MNTIVIEIEGLKTVSESNMRHHWSKRAKRAKAQRESAHAHCLGAVFRAYGSVLPAVVTITRLGPRKLDTGNLGSALKAVQDGIADAIGIDDGSDLYDWQYRQEVGKKVGVKIEIAPKEAGNE